MISEIMLGLWVALLLVFVGGFLSFFWYLKRRSKGPWGFEIDPRFRPSVSIIVPAFNEEKLIRQKLENLQAVSYPKDKMEVVLVDDCSTDQTLARAALFVEQNPGFVVKIVRQPVRKGKANALNSALGVCSAGFVVVTDADTFLPEDVLVKTLPYMSNEGIGALSSLAVPRSLPDSWVSNAEKDYLDMMSAWRLGESKIHSTFRFEGCFCVFRRSAFEEFDSVSGADDSGTALRIIQNGFRTVLVPEARVPADVPGELGVYIRSKTRRAVQLAGLWAQCLRFLFKGNLKLPKRIAVPEIFLSLFMPFVFVALVVSTFVLILFYPLPFVLLAVAVGLACLVPKVRNFLVRSVVDQLILFYAVLLFVGKKKFVVWEHNR